MKNKGRLCRAGLVTLLLASLSAAAQADTILKFKSSVVYGNSKSQSGEAVVCANGKIYTAGAGSESSLPRGLAVSYEDLGGGPPKSSLLWQRLPGTLSSEVFTAIGVTDEGAYYAGRTWTDEKHGGPLLAKFALEKPKNAIWTVQPPENNNYHDVAYLALLPVKERDNTAIYATGYAADREKNRTAILMKYDTKGTLLWFKSLTASEAGNRAAGVSLAYADGFVYVAGYLGKGKKAANYDTVVPGVALWKFDAAGNQIWMVDESKHRVFLMPGEVRDAKMGMLISGRHLYVAASRYASKKAAAMILKYDTDGALVWSTVWNAKTGKGKPNMSFASDLTDGGDRVFVTGWAQYAATDPLPADEDVIVLEVDKKYGFVLAGHEYGETDVSETALGAGKAEGYVYAAGSRRAWDKKGDANSDLGVFKYEVRKPLEVRIDILPEDPSNALKIDDPDLNGKMTVAIFSTPDFNAATMINKKTIRFGRSGLEPSWKGSIIKDIDKDGKVDMLCTFKTSFPHQKKAVYIFEPGDAAGLLTADTSDGQPVFGKDSIHVETAGVPAAITPEETAPEQVDEPAIAEPADEPVVNEPVADRPAADNPAADEPASDESAPAELAPQEPASPVLVSAPPVLSPDPAEVLMQETEEAAQAQLTDGTTPSTASAQPILIPVATTADLGPVFTPAGNNLETQKLPGSKEAPKSAPVSSSKTDRLRSESIGVLVSREESSDTSSSGSGREASSDTTSSDGTGTGLFQAYLEEGKSAYQRARFKEAIVHFKEALSWDPDSAEANKYLGLAFLGVDDVKSAHPYLSKALRLNPKDAMVREKLAAIQIKP